MTSQTGRIAVVCGLKSEAAAVRAVFVDDARIRVGVSGASAEHAYEIAKAACAEGARAVLSVGVSGGLDPRLQPGELVVGDEIIADDGARYAANPNLVRVIKRDDAPAFRIGPLLGANEIVQTTARKSALFSRYGALAVDMESHGAARAAAETGVPFLAIRAIADPADRALPPAALEAVAPDGSTRVFKTLAAALRDPKQFPALMKLGSDSDVALKTLRRNLGPIFERLYETLKL